jgi:hypothetical protein
MRLLYLILGFISLGVGIIGIALPVLPTTPFLLLTTLLFAKSSPKFHDWFVSTKLYEIHLKTFIETRSMTKRQKWSLLLFVDLICIITFIMIDSWVVRGTIILLEIAKYFYFIKYVKTI